MSMEIKRFRDEVHLDESEIADLIRAAAEHSTGRKVESVHIIPSSNNMRAVITLKHEDEA